MGGSRILNSICKLCRLCGRSPPLAFKNAIDDRNDWLNHLILKYIGIPITSGDALPTEICNECVTRLEIFHEYAQTCIRIQATLLENSNLDTYEDDDDDDDEDDTKVKIERSSPSPLFPDTKEEEDEGIRVKQEFVAEDFSVDFLADDSILPEGDDYNYDTNSDAPLTQIKKRKKLKTKRSIKSETDVQKPVRGDMRKYFKFDCFVCNVKFANWFRLKTHTINVHQQAPRVKCDCGFVVKSKTAIYRHISAHNTPANYSCDKCNRITKTKVALERHLSRHKPKENQVFPCMNCPKICTSKENLRSHERVHFPLSERYKYPCHICEQKFTTRSAVMGHIRAVHEKIKRFVCDICGYACSTGGELVQHRAIHSDEKLYQCPTCSKRFKTSSNLKAHLDTHATTSYPCGICGKVLNSRRTLRKHFLVHEEVCKHVCSYCNKAFKRRQTLKAHLTIHTGDKPIQCQWCPQKFSYSSVYRSHKHKVHFDKILKSENTDKIVAPEENKTENNQIEVLENTQILPEKKDAILITNTY